MMNIVLSTANCIVTGKPATLWSGHVHAAMTRPMCAGERNRRNVPISIIAGFVDRATHDAAQSDAFGCFGDWQKSHGIRTDIIDAYEIPSPVEQETT